MWIDKNHRAYTQLYPFVGATENFPTKSRNSYLQYPKKNTLNCKNFRFKNLLYGSKPDSWHPRPEVRSLPVNQGLYIIGKVSTENLLQGSNFQNNYTTD